MVWLRAVPKAFRGAKYGEGEGPVHMAFLDCTGEEEALVECVFRTADDHTCGHRLDASLLCSGTCLVGMHSIIFLSYYYYTLQTRYSTTIYG